MDGDANRPRRPRAFYLAHLIAALSPPPLKPSLEPVSPLPPEPLWAPSPGLVALALNLAIPA